MHRQVFDIAIIGGGLNGTAIARDASGRGQTVFLCEADDLGAGSSSATGKIVHGGLRHLGGLHFGALREGVIEREILMRAAPHLVRPTWFVLPHHERQWPQWALSAGLYVGDHVARQTLPGRRRIDLSVEKSHGALQPHFDFAFGFSDCVVDDSRLVIVNAIDARTRGASIYPRQRCIVAEREGERWRLSLESSRTGERFTVQSHVLVNAAGAEAGAVLNHVIHTNQRVRPRMRKAGYIVVRRRLAVGRAYALPTADGRIVYALPWQGDHTLIGASDSPHYDDPTGARVTPRETGYLLDAVNQYFERRVAVGDIVRTFMAVAALPDDAGAAKHEHAILVDAPPRSAPLVSVFGGTITSHRLIGEHVLDRISRFRRMGRAWTASAVLPGGGLPIDGVDGLGRALSQAYPFVSAAHSTRLARAYGTRAQAILSGARKAADLGICFGADLTEAEVDFLRAQEWALTATDVLWRRSKLGLRFSKAERDALDGWMAANRASAPAPATA